jgi:osmotically-inducible protein OsmY
MDPIRTAVKYSLIPLRAVVHVGESFVGEEPEQEAAPEARRSRRPQRRQSQKRAATQRRSAARPQATTTPKDLDDVGLARKVETVIFRDRTVPKGKIDVNAADGVVWLRGEAKTPDMIKLLERQTAAIPEVKRVENLLHLPKTPAPTRADTPPSEQQTHSTSEGEGRQPAPLGANGTTT